MSTKQIELNDKEIENLVFEIADIACWINGIKIGIKLNDYCDDFFIPNIQNLRKLNLKLKDLK